MRRRRAPTAVRAGAAPHRLSHADGDRRADSATRIAFLTFLPFVLTASATLPTVGAALTLVFAGGAVGAACAFLGADRHCRYGVGDGDRHRVGIAALLPLPLEGVLVLLPVVGRSTAPSVFMARADLVAPDKRVHAFGIFYTGTIGAGAAPAVFGAPGDLMSVNLSMLCIAGLLADPAADHLAARSRRSALIAREKAEHDLRRRDANQSRFPAADGTSPASPALIAGFHPQEFLMTSQVRHSVRLAAGTVVLPAGTAVASAQGRSSPANRSKPVRW